MPHHDLQQLRCCATTTIIGSASTTPGSCPVPICNGSPTSSMHMMSSMSRPCGVGGSECRVILANILVVRGPPWCHQPSRSQSYVAGNKQPLYQCVLCRSCSPLWLRCNAMNAARKSRNTTRACLSGYILEYLDHDLQQLRRSATTTTASASATPAAHCPIPSSDA